MDVIDLLVADHNRMRGLFSRYRDADEASDQAAVSALAATIIEELNVHMEAEEDVFYRSVKERSEDIGEDVDEGYEEHHVAKVLIGEIEGLEPGSDPWIAKMTVLMESVEHHVGEEEDELFPSVRSSSEGTWRDELGERLDSEKVRLGAPSLASKLPLSMSDLRDKAREQEIPGRSKMAHDELAATVDTRAS